MSILGNVFSTLMVTDLKPWKYPGLKQIYDMNV